MHSLIISLAIFSILWTSASAIPQPDLRAQTPYTFEDIFNPALRPKGFSPRWIKGTDDFYYFRSSTGDVMRYNTSTESEGILIPKAIFDREGTTTYYVSPDLSHVLFAYDTESLWRHSFNARYKIMNMASGVISDFPTGALAGKLLNYANWAPSTNAISFVHENDLYYQPSPSANPIRVTVDGHETDIFNGVPDWLYEEDVLSERVSHYWSPESTFICFAKINVSQVPLISWPLYGVKSDVYGSTREIRYPKAGDVRDGKPGPNSVVDLYVFDADGSSNPTLYRILPPADLNGRDHYYVQVAWQDDITVMVTWTNRVQNESYSIFYDVIDDPIATNGYRYEVSGGWVEVAPPTPTFIDSETYVTIHPKPRGNDTWRQLAVYNRTGASLRYISEDMDEEVDFIYGYSTTTQRVYYSATNGDPTERHIKWANLVDNENGCLTCDFPDGCRYITSSFSENADYYFVNCRGPEVPTYTLRTTRAGVQMDIVMENNTDVRERLQQKALPTRTFLQVPIGGGYMGSAEIFTPPGHVQGKKYPLLVYAYAGPGSQRVMKTFPMGSNTANWLTYLKNNAVIVSVDSRGASGRGDKFKFEMYRNLGTVEVQDQILAAQFFGANPMVDEAKAMAVFGWSYGGGTAAHVIGDSSKVITCGISVAPVTTKMYYDTAYTERYLGFATPDDDELGYNNTDVMHKVENFRNKTYMINHGMADDNVHYMHTTQLIQALANADILFKQNAYIDQNHGISSPGPARHLYHTMSNFLENECWPALPEKPDEKPDEKPSAAFRHTASLITCLLLALLVVFQ